MLPDDHIFSAVEGNIAYSPYRFQTLRSEFGRYVGYHGNLPLVKSVFELHCAGCWVTSRMPWEKKPKRFWIVCKFLLWCHTYLSPSFTLTETIRQKAVEEGRKWGWPRVIDLHCADVERLLKMLWEKKPQRCWIVWKCLLWCPGLSNFSSAQLFKKLLGVSLAHPYKLLIVVGKPWCHMLPLHPQRDSARQWKEAVREGIIKEDLASWPKKK
jgi:hypothetical protein